MYKIAICDDDKDIQKLVARCLEKEFGAEIECSFYDQAVELIQAFEESKAPKDEIIILDIVFSEMDGISAALKLQKEFGQNVKIIYLTGHIDYATEIFDSEPTYFLTKPIKEEKLIAAVRKAMDKITEEKKDFIACRVNGSVNYYNCKNIVFVESDCRRLNIHLFDETVTVHMKMDEMEKELPAYFLRCHQSYIVNMAYIKAFMEKEIDLGKYGRISISRSNLKKAKEIFMKYLGESL